MHSFKIGDLVQPTEDSLRFCRGYYATHNNIHLPLTITDLYQGSSGSTCVRWRDAIGRVGDCMSPTSFEPYSVAPKPFQKATPTFTPMDKHWFIAVIDKADKLPRPNSPPRTYTSASQARAVARSMAEKNRSETFVVYEATDVIVAPPVTLPETQSFKL